MVPRQTIASLKSLEQLDLSATGITDASLTEIAKLNELQVLWLAKTTVTDEGLKHLATLPNLKVPRYPRDASDCGRN